MRTSDRFEFMAEAEHQREGMIAASRTLLKGRNALFSGILTLALTVLAGLGGVALVTFITTLTGSDPTWLVLLGWFAGGALYILSFQLLYKDMSKAIAKRPLHQGLQAITFDETGMTYEAAPAQWTTPWAMIDGVIETKQTITINVSGIAFVLPKSAVGDEDAVASLLSDLKDQIGNA